MEPEIFRGHYTPAQIPRTARLFLHPSESIVSFFFACLPARVPACLALASRRRRCQASQQRRNIRRNGSTECAGRRRPTRGPASQSAAVRRAGPVHPRERHHSKRHPLPSLHMLHALIIKPSNRTDKRNEKKRKENQQHNKTTEPFFRCCCYCCRCFCVETERQLMAHVLLCQLQDDARSIVVTNKECTRTGFRSKEARTLPSPLTNRLRFFSSFSASSTVGRDSRPPGFDAFQRDQRRHWLVYVYGRQQFGSINAKRLVERR